jgi:hypothetical protein
MLRKEYNALSAADRAELQTDIEKSARLDGYTQEPLGGYDASGFLLFMILQETLFLRFDANWDGYLDTSEALQAAVPMREFIAKQANLDPNQEKILGILDENEVLDAIFTFTMAKAKVPKMDLGGYTELVLWLLDKDDWKVHAGRAITYKNSSQFADFSKFPP